MSFEDSNASIRIAEIEFYLTPGDSTHQIM